VKKLLIIIITLLIIIAACDRSKNTADETEEIEIVQFEQEEITPVIFGLMENEFKATYDIGGIVYRIRIPSDIEVRKQPMLDSEITHILRKDTVIEIVGVDNIMYIIRNDSEEKIFRLAITWGENHYGPQNYGWVLSSDLNIEGCFMSELQIINTQKNEQGNLILDVLHTFDGYENEFSITAFRLGEQNVYTFFWDYRNENFHYSGNPGLYKWNDETKELFHISYIISDGYQGWRYIVTNEFKYLIKYSERRNSQLNGVNIWNLENDETILSGRYYGNFKLDGNTVELARYYDTYISDGWQNHEGLDNWIYGNYLTDNEKAFGKNFIETNKIPDDLIEEVEQGYGIKYIMLMIIIEYDFETNTRNIIDGKYIVHS